MHHLAAIAFSLMTPPSSKLDYWTLNYLSVGTPYTWSQTFSGSFNGSGEFYEDITDFWSVSNIATPSPIPELEPDWHYGLDQLGADWLTIRYGVTGTPYSSATFGVTFYDGDDWSRGVREGYPTLSHWDREKLYFTSSGPVLPITD